MERNGSRKRVIILGVLVALAGLSVTGHYFYKNRPPTKPLFRFMAIADTHIAGPNELAAFRNFLNDVRDEDVDFLLLLGDLCGHAPEYLPQIRDVILQSGVKVYVLPGNHDDNYGKNQEWFRDVFGRNFYIFDHCGWRFIMNWSQAQPLEWLRRNLAELPPDKPVVFCQHYPPSLKATDAQKELEKEPWVSLLKHPEVRLILGGHTHRRTEGELSGTKCVVLSKFFVGREDSQEKESDPDKERERLERESACTVFEAFADGRIIAHHRPLRTFQLREPPDAPPTVSVIEPVAGAMLRDRAVFSGTASDDEAVKSVEYNVNFGPWISAEGAAQWRFTFDTKTVSDGHHLFQLRAVDSTGQASIFLRQMLCLVENMPRPRSFFLRQGLDGYDGCRDVTVRLQGNEKKSDGSEGEASDLECWAFRNKKGLVEFSEFYIKFDLRQTKIPSKAKIVGIVLVLYCTRQNLVDAEGLRCGFLVDVVPQHWEETMTFQDRPAKPGRHCLEKLNPPPALQSTWPYPGKRQFIMPPCTITVDLTSFKCAVEKWLRAPDANNGWVFSPAFGKNYNISFKSSRCEIATLRPCLELVFESETE